MGTSRTLNSLKYLLGRFTDQEYNKPKLKKYFKARYVDRLVNEGNKKFDQEKFANPKDYVAKLACGYGEDGIISSAVATTYKGETINVEITNSIPLIIAIGRGSSAGEQAILISENGGNSFENVSAKFQAYAGKNMLPQKIIFANGYFYMAVSDLTTNTFYFYKTADGLSWKNVGGGNISSAYTLLNFAYGQYVRNTSGVKLDTNYFLVVTTESYGFYITEDFNTWNKCRTTSGAPLTMGNVLLCQGETILWQITNGNYFFCLFYFYNDFKTLYVSNDPYKSGADEYIAICGNSEAWAICSGTGEIYTSWQSDKIAFLGSSTIVRMAFLDTNTLYVVGFEGLTESGAKGRAYKYVWNGSTATETLLGTFGDGDTSLQSLITDIPLFVGLSGAIAKGDNFSTIASGTEYNLYDVARATE